MASRITKAVERAAPSVKKALRSGITIRVPNRSSIGAVARPLTTLAHSASSRVSEKDNSNPILEDRWKSSDVYATTKFGVQKKSYSASAALPPHQPILMPAMSPTMTQGNIATWQKKVGDQFSSGDVLCEVETDKATLNLESMEDGYLAAVLVPAGTKDIPVGKPIAIMVDSEDDIAAFANYTGDGGDASADAASTPPPPPPAAAPAPTGSFPPHVRVPMPSLSPTMTQGNIFKWHKAEGDELAAGDVLCEIETDKATLSMETTEDGFLAKILMPEGSKDVPVGTQIAVMVDSADDVPKFASYTPEAAAAPPPSSPPSTPAAAPPTPAAPAPKVAAPAEATSAPPKRAAGERIFISPVARALALEHQLDISLIQGTGPEGRILKADVEEYLAKGPVPVAQAAVAPGAVAAPIEEISSAELRKEVAARLTRSIQTIPHYYLSIDAKIDKLQNLVEQLNSLQDKSKAVGGTKVTVDSLIIKAAALASKNVPEVNSVWAGDFIRQFNNVDINLTVFTPYGLVNPVIRDADKKGLSIIAQEAESLTDGALANELTADQRQTGTFTINSASGSKIRTSSAVINPDQSAILSVGATQERVVPAKAAGEFAVAEFKTFTLSCDHRVIDGAVGAQWLGAFKTYIEDPLALLL